MSIFSFNHAGEMARPKSEDKRRAILSAATKVFAERGLGAPTSAISSEAKVAEGMLFVYFQTKDDLVNALYREIKGEMAAAMASGLPRDRGVRDKLRYVWDNYVGWGIANPLQHDALKQIEVWNGLTRESREAGAASFPELQAMAEAAVEASLARSPRPRRPPVRPQRQR
jgi:AcrR family transcriptional regulator